MYNNNANNTTATGEFIGGHIGHYGLLGKNTREIGLDRAARNDAQAPEFTRGNHFKFGFDGGVYNTRPTQSSNYWVEYGAVTRPHLSFEQELRLALREIADRYGAFSVTSSRSYIAAMVAAEATKLGLAIRRVAIEIEGLRPIEVAEDVETKHHVVSWEQFCLFAKDFATRAGCSDPWVAFEAMHGEYSESIHVYDGAEMRIENNNFDRRNRCAVGDAEWSFVDNEKFTAVNRFLMDKRRPGIPQILRWSPELMAAQIDSAQYRQWFQYASTEGRSQPAGAHNRLARLGLAAVTAAGSDINVSVRQARCAPELKQLMKSLRRTMKNIAPGCATQHRYPLWRLSRLLGVNRRDLFNVSPEWYGTVDE